MGENLIAFKSGGLSIRLDDSLIAYILILILVLGRGLIYPRVDLRVGPPFLVVVRHKLYFHYFACALHQHCICVAFLNKNPVLGQLLAVMILTKRFCVNIASAAELFSKPSCRKGTRSPKRQFRFVCFSRASAIIYVSTGPSKVPKSPVTTDG